MQAVLSPLVAGPASVAIGPFLSPDLRAILLIACLGPIALCLLLAYTYFAIAIPLLLVAYLGLVFPDIYPALVVYATSAALAGGIALALGIVGELKHAAEKRREVLARYGVRRVPYQVLLVGGSLGLIGVLVQAAIGKMNETDLLVLAVGSALELFSGITLYVSKNSLPNKSPEPTPGSVTPPAKAHVAPPPSAAHL